MADAALRAAGPRERLRRDRACGAGRCRNGRAPARAGLFQRRADVARKGDGRGDLGIRKGRRAAVVSGIDDLDADRGRVEVALAFPMARAGVPGAIALGDQLIDPPVLPDEIMRRDLGGRIDQQSERILAGRHAGVMKDKRIGRPHAAPLAKIRRGEERGGERTVAGRTGHQFPSRDRRPPALPSRLTRDLSCTRRRRCGCHSGRSHAARNGGADASRRCRPGRRPPRRRRRPQ